MVNDVPRDHPYYMGRYQTKTRDVPPLQIHDALRLHCHINFKQCFVATVTPDNAIQTFISPGQKLEKDVRNQFFDERKFRAVMERVETGVDPMLQASPSGRRNSTRATTSTSSRSSRSQAPTQPTRRRGGGKKERSTTVNQLRSVRVSDSEAIWNFYEECLRAASQVVCKSLAKTWIKTFEPKKQTNHPYTGEDATAPSWWPRPWGSTSEEKVRHKEPDHQRKPERIHLLAYMLRMVTEPAENQHPQVRRMGLNVDTLTEVMADSMVRDFTAKPEAEKCLREMLRIARAEERYKAGELDGSARLHISAEYEDADMEEESLVKEENEDLSSQTSSAAAAAAALAASQTPDQGSSPAALGPPGQFLNDLPAIRSHFGHPTMPDVHSHTHHHQPQPHQSLSPNSEPMVLDMVESPQDTSRRTSMFTDYTGTGASPMQYQTQWQPGSTAATGSPIYAYNAGPGGPPQPPYMHPAGNMGQAQGFMGTGFEGHPRQVYDATPTALFRGNDMAQAQGTHAHGYNYLSPDGRGTRGAPGVDPTHRNHMG